MTVKLFAALTAAGAEWVMMLLVGLSVVSVAIVLERLVFFSRRSTSALTRELLPLITAGRLAEVRKRLDGVRGLEAAVARDALAVVPAGAAAVNEVVACVLARERPRYERYLAFLGTLGNNAPFLGLFGTVVGVIKAFADLALTGAKAAGAASVMGGISEALVATAVGIFVAIPAVVAFNAFGRWLKSIVARSEAIGHALAAHIEQENARQLAPRSSQSDSPRTSSLALCVD
jgi:biopolymer transport protein ExbB